ncbi:hypothetical protein HS961_20705 [Comamonas piscis]|uniref:Uncharacterized protein n=1 Tax=Comamonas piscis TaxID=1562974 RepID=A0A7G5EM42_9BURK|nr:hypothetical protein [Comamonas piscis]QMV75067.1 hypothetical protein HS961_20705 [Comamonas piscis]WSO33551.1 hypothetical protein VUJ63_20770 [Comamonas piscis]
MAIVIVKKTAAPTQAVTPSQSKRTTGHAKPLPIDTSALLKPGRLKPGHLMTLFGISHSTLYARRATGLIPPPDLKEYGRPLWFTSTIAPFFGVKE